MKKSLNLILFITLSVAGATLPANTALAAGEQTYFVPIEPCRLLNTRAMGRTPGNSGTPVPFVATKVRAASTMFDTKHFFVNGGDAIIGAQGGNTADGERCNIPSEAVAIAINFTVNIPRGAISWLRVWPYEGTLEENEDGAKATVMSWDGKVVSNAMSLSIVQPGIGFHFTLRVFFDTGAHPVPEDNSAHIIGDALGYYVEFTP